MSWDARWVAMCRLVATWSKDRSRKNGCVIVNDRNSILSVGWNGFPRGLNDDIKERHARPTKYAWTEHGERNAIYNAASIGIPLRGATLYTTWFPCVDCARAVIQSGIARIVCEGGAIDDPVWGDSFSTASLMIEEADIPITYHNG